MSERDIVLAVFIGALVLSCIAVRVGFYIAECAFKTGVLKGYEHAQSPLLSSREVLEIIRESRAAGEFPQ